MNQRHKISLALQGGGSHAAFGWGVLAALAQDSRLVVDGISGTSGGAINAALFSYGWQQGGAAKAIELLQSFWQRVAELAVFSPFQPTAFDKLTQNNNLEYSPLMMGYDWLSKFLTPYQLNPLNINPLRDLLTSLIDFKALQQNNTQPLYISATNVRTGQLRVFARHEITVEVLLASACLPQLFQAVTIDGEDYWDGGFMGNPTLHPLVNHCGASDILLVQINPMRRPLTPKTAHDIMDRVNEISFNASLVTELKGLQQINRLLGAGELDAQSCRLRQIYVHRVADEAAMCKFSAASKLNADYKFACGIKDLGVAAYAAWAAENLEFLGVQSTFSV